MLGSTATFSIWVQFFVEYYSFWIPAEPVCFADIGGPVPVGPNGDDGQEKLLGKVFSWLKTNPECFLFLCSHLTVLHWKLWICCHLRRW